VSSALRRRSDVRSSIPTMRLQHYLEVLTAEVKQVREEGGGGDEPAARPAEVRPSR
jgi:hypothetical protein